jgi:hypothetical protein
MDMNSGTKRRNVLKVVNLRGKNMHGSLVVWDVVVEKTVMTFIHHRLF